eukprot:123908-Hanusia_phi.AAC.2
MLTEVRRAQEVYKFCSTVENLTMADQLQISSDVYKVPHFAMGDFIIEDQQRLFELAMEKAQREPSSVSTPSSNWSDPELFYFGKEKGQHDEDEGRGGGGEEEEGVQVREEDREGQRGSGGDGGGEIPGAGEGNVEGAGGTPCAGDADQDGDGGQVGEEG